MSATVHSRLIADLAAEGCRTIGFRRQMLRVLKKNGHGVGADEEIAFPRRSPDAFTIAANADTGWIEVRVWEVECTNPLTPEKVADYAQFWFELDASEALITFEVWTVDRFGVRRRYDLESAWYGVQMAVAS